MIGLEGEECEGTHCWPPPRRRLVGKASSSSPRQPVDEKATDVCQGQCFATNMQNMLLLVPLSEIFTTDLSFNIAEMYKHPFHDKVNHDGNHIIRIDPFWGYLNLTSANWLSEIKPFIGQERLQSLVGLPSGSRLQVLPDARAECLRNALPSVIMHRAFFGSDSTFASIWGLRAMVRDFRFSALKAWEKVHEFVSRAPASQTVEQFLSEVGIVPFIPTSCGAHAAEDAVLYLVLLRALVMAYRHQPAFAHMLERKKTSKWAPSSPPVCCV